MFLKEDSMTVWTTQICKVNGIDVHYLRTGGNKPCVVLLHGLMLNGACWTTLARTLEKDYDVIMPDARGHGSSSAPESGYSYNELAADVIGLIDELKLEAPVLLGHSMGGMTAAVVASKSLKQLKGLVLADPTFLTPQWQIEVYQSDVANQHRQVLNRSKQDFLDEMLARRTHRTREVVEQFVQARFQTSIQAFEILKPPNPDYMQLIKAIDVASLLVIGDTNSVVSSEVAAELAVLNPHLQVVQIAQASHGLPYDQPEQFSSVVQTFLRSVISAV